MSIDDAFPCHHGEVHALVSGREMHLRLQRFHRRSCVWLALACLVPGCAVAPHVSPEPPIAPQSSAAAGATTIVAIAPPPTPKTPPPTLWQFLGVPQAAAGVVAGVDRVRNRLGTRFPGLEAKPELLAISDPDNLKSPNPAVKSAAEVKAEEDAAPQKAKAINYLAKIGCGCCYPNVEVSLLAALDDCTEEVRYAAATALRDRSGHVCQKCKNNACCSEAVIRRLQDVAYAVDDKGCFKEPSARVRRMARLALAGCGCAVETLPPVLEGPSSETVPKGEPTKVEGPGGTAGLPANGSPVVTRLPVAYPQTATPFESRSEGIVPVTAIMPLDGFSPPRLERLPPVDALRAAPTFTPLPPTRPSPIPRLPSVGPPSGERRASPAG